MSGATVSEIFASMEYGPAKEDESVAQAWLERHARNFGHFIDGRWVKPEGRESYTSENPATGRSLASTLQGCSSDASLAVKSSREAFRSWSALPCHTRARHLYSLARTVQKHQSLFSVLESLDHGKPVQECRNFDVPNVIRQLYHDAGWAELRDGEMRGWQPLGVVAATVSSSFPLMTLSCKLSPALAMGNTVVVKPDTRTRLSALLFAEICAEAGLPPGVVNVVTGDEDFGVELAQHSDVDKVDFTGSTERGRALCRDSAGSGKALSLRLGAKSSCIVFDSADLDSATEGIVEEAWSSQGQLCSAGSVLLVQESVWEPLLSRLRVRMSRLRCGSGLEKSVDLAPLVDESQRSSLEALVEEAKREGAEVFQVCGPSLSMGGPFYPPTLLTGLAPASRFFREEISGPVLAALPFRTAKEAIALANNSRYGLGASVWTESLALALEVAGSLQVGSVWVNAHSLVDAAAGFGGVKESGFGRDGGREGLFEYLRPAWSSRPRPSTSDLDYKSFGTSCETPPLPQGVGGGGREGEETPKVDRSYKLYIGGSQVRPDSGYSRPVLTAGGELLACVPDGNRKDIRNAVESANKTQPGWLKKGPHTRAQILYFIAENLELRGAEFAQGLSLQSAISLEDAQKEVGLSVARLFHWAALCDKYGGSVQETPFRGSTLCFREPIGVVGVVCPDEKPLLSFVTLMGAAICRGNAVVMVPSPSNPLPALAMCQVLETSDLPGGVVNIVSGERDQLTRHLTGHSSVQSVWYFGSEQGSQFVEWGSADNLKRTWVNYGQPRDWSSPVEGAGEEFLLHATQCKNMWIPAGEIYAN